MICPVRAGSVLALVACLACSERDTPPHPVEPPPAPAPVPVVPSEEPPPPVVNEIRVLNLDTYDGSGQVVHPDVTRTPERWARRRKHLVITPYPNGSSSEENPSVFLADNGLTWKMNQPGINPIARPRAGGYLSDPDEVYNPETRELWVYYRQVTGQNEIYLKRSRDALNWSEPVLVVSAPNHQIVSPSIVRISATEWLMWAVNAEAAGCGGTATTVELRRSTNGIDWSAPTTVSLANGTVFAWHINVEWIPSRGEFWAIYNGKTAGSCTTPELFFAKSTDGIHWQVFPTPLLKRGTIPEFQDIVYRSTFQYDADDDEVTFWYSGARYDSGKYIWRAAMQRMPRATVFALEHAPAVTAETRAAGTRMRRMTRITRAPPLTNRTAP